MGEVKVKFKHEGESRGQPYGPVAIIDVDAMLADPVMEGHTLGMPYGYKPKWLDDRGWLTRNAALLLAKEHGVKLEES